MTCKRGGCCSRPPICPFKLCMCPALLTLLPDLPTCLPINLPSYLPTCILVYLHAYLPTNHCLPTHPLSYLPLTQYQRLSMDITVREYSNKIICNHFSNIQGLIMIKYQTLMKVLHSTLWPWFYNCSSTLDYLMHNLPNLI